MSKPLDPDEAQGGSERNETISVTTSYHLPQADLFRRSQPASLEGSSDRWDAVRTVVDFGAALLQASGATPSDRPLRRAVVAAMLRRAVITGEGIRHCLSAGLHEPAIGLFRTLLDIDLNLKLVTVDKTDRMAKRLAAYHYYGYQLHGQDMLSDRTTREGFLARTESVGRTRDVSRSYANFLEQPVFDDVREDVRGSRYWHGFDRPGDAFASVGTKTDYLMTYDTTTFFIHASNVDHDLAEIVDGQLRMKALVERDPAIMGLHLAHVAVKLYEVYRAFTDDQGIPEPFLSPPAAKPGEGTDVVRLNSMDGLMIFVTQRFEQTTEGAPKQ